MPAILTPAVALRYLLQLSTDVRAAAVLDGDGLLLAGDSSLAAPARELLGVLDGVVGGEQGRGEGELLVPLHRDGRRLGSAHALRAPATPLAAAAATRAGAARPSAVALVVAAGPHALLPLLRHDLAAVLRDAAGEASSASQQPPEPPPISPGEVVAWDASRRVQLIRAADSAAGTAIFAGLGLLGSGNP